MVTVGKRRFSKAARVLLFPAFALAFIVGWCMYVVGDRKRAAPPKRKQRQDDGVTFLPTVLEEQELVNH